MTGFDSINARILFGYGAILLATLIAAALLTGSNYFMRAHLDDFVEQTLPDLKQVNILQARIKQLVLNGYSLYGTTLSPDEFAAARDRLGPDMSAAFEALAMDTERPRIRADLRQLEQDLSTLANLMQQTSVDWDQARQELSDLNDTAKTLDERLEQLGERIARQASAGVGTIKTQLDGSLWTLYLLVIILLAVAIGGFLLSQRQIARPIAGLAQHLDRIAAAKDLAQRLETQGTRELDSMSASINGLIAMFRQGMGEVTAAIAGIGESVTQLGQTTVDSGAVVEQLQTEIAQLLAVMQALETQMDNCVQRSESAAAEAHRSGEQMALGQEQVQHTAQSIGALAEEIDTTSERLQRLHNAGDQVSGVVHTIAEIAEQTNLLALNATIEAARAGEAGRGFAVVADEVRTLAMRTQQATVEINAMLDTIVQSIEAAVTQMAANRDQAQASVGLSKQLVETLEDARGRIVSLVDVSQDAAGIATDSRTRAAQIREQVSDFDRLGTRVSESNAKVHDASNLLSQLAQRLADTVARFKH